MWSNAKRNTGSNTPVRHDEHSSLTLREQNIFCQIYLHVTGGE
jgi:hypothetical protein